MWTKGEAGAKPAAMYAEKAAPMPGEPLAESENEIIEQHPESLTSKGMTETSDGGVEQAMCSSANVRG